MLFLCDLHSYNYFIIFCQNMQPQIPGIDGKIMQKLPPEGSSFIYLQSQVIHKQRDLLLPGTFVMGAAGEDL